MSDSLYSIFGKLTSVMSKEKRINRNNDCQMIWQLPEMVSSLRSDIYFNEHFESNKNTESQKTAEAETMTEAETKAGADDKAHEFKLM